MTPGSQLRHYRMKHMDVNCRSRRSASTGLVLFLLLTRSLSGTGLAQNASASEQRLSDGDIRGAVALYEQALRSSSDPATRVEILRKLSDLDLHLLAPRASRRYLQAADVDAAHLPPNSPQVALLDVVHYRSAIIDEDSATEQRLASTLKRLRDDKAIGAEAADELASTLEFYLPENDRKLDSANRLAGIARRQIASLGPSGDGALRTQMREALRLSGAGQSTQGISLIDSVVATRNRDFGELHPETLLSELARLQILGDLNQLSAHAQESGDLAQRAAQVFGDQSRDTFIAVGRAYQAAVLAGRAPADRRRLAEMGHREGVALYGASSPFTLQFGMDYGTALVERGELERGLSLYEQSLRWDSHDYKQLDAAHLDAVDWLSVQYANAHREVDQRRMSDICVSAVRQIRGGGDPRSFLCFATNATLYASINELPQAEQSARVALKLSQTVRPSNPEFVVSATLELAGILLGSKNSLPESLSLFEAAAQEAKGLSPDARSRLEPQFAQGRNVHVVLCRIQSEELCQRANQLNASMAQLVSGRSLAAISPSADQQVLDRYVSGLSNLETGHAPQAARDFATARDEVHRSQLSSGETLSRVLEAEIAAMQAAAADAQRDRQAALQYIQEAEALGEDARVQPGLSEHERALAFEPIAALYRLLADACGRHLHDPTAAFRLIERGKARLLLDRLAWSKSVVNTLAGPELGPKLRAAREAVEHARSRLWDAKNKHDAAQESLATAELNRATQAFDELRLSATAASPQVDAVLAPAVATLSQIQRALSPDESWISYVILPKDAMPISAGKGYASGDVVLAAMVVTKDQVKYQPLGQIHAILSLVQAYRTQLGAQGERGAKPSAKDSASTETRSGPSRIDPSQQLGVVLLDPLASELKGRRLIISPDGVLSQLPFASLPFKGKYLIESFELVQTPSAAVWLMQKGRATGQAGGGRPMIAMGGARYSRETRVTVSEGEPPIVAEWPEIPGTLREVQQLEKIVPGTLAIKGADASEARLAQLNAQGDLTRLRVLHLAAHGFYDASDPLLSGVVLDLQGTNARYNGVVTAEKLLSYRFNTELVVLSACETALGKQEYGEGSLGLSWALAVAGNRNLLASLWKVSDEGTSELMIRFYTHLMRGTSVSRSLATAQREMIASGAFRDPYLWAPFVLQGT
jgi:CHAT domain-containing protein